MGREGRNRFFKRVSEAGPEIRTMPIPPSPKGVAGAAMVSSVTKSRLSPYSPKPKIPEKFFILSGRHVALCSGLYALKKITQAFC